MSRSVLWRSLQTILILLLLSYVCFALMTLMPGDPVELMITSNPKIGSEDMQRLRMLYGLDQPTPLRYYHWLTSFLKGDLGYSRTYRVPVMDLLAPRMLNTFYLAMSSLVLALLIAVPLGVLSALRTGTWIDSLCGVLSSLSLSTPSFWTGLVLILIFGGWWPILPPGGTFSIGLSEDSPLDAVLDRLSYLVLPVVSLAFVQLGRFLRLTRGAMMEALKNDYIRTARAKGLPVSTILWRHAFRNALLPLITIVALSFSSLFSGALITETVFAYHGVGHLLYEAIRSNDFNLAMVAFLFSMTAVFAFNGLADLAYGWADPRISHH